MQNNTMTNLPQSWEVKKIGEIGEIFSGSSAPQNKEYFIDGTYKFVRTKDLSLKGKTKNLIEIETNINDLAINTLQLIEAPKRGGIISKKWSFYRNK
ncbi:restriction endonuclease subunit S [Campylobacter jejuni]